jgi:hypothetical protein
LTWQTASPAQDLYALGALLRQLFTQELPVQYEFVPIANRQDIPAGVIRLVADLMSSEAQPTAAVAAQILRRYRPGRLQKQMMIS